MVVSRLAQSRWRKVDREETKQMKSHRVFGGGGTNLDLSESAIAAVDRYKESAGPGAAALACRIPPLSRQRVRDSGSTSSQSGGISILDFRVTTLSPQEVIFVH